MGILRVDHPDIMRFITLKQDGVTLNNFNISVGLTEAFMEAVEKDEEYNLISPTTGDRVQRINARHVFDLLILNAWRTGDPGILFLDRIHYSRANPLITKKEICATSPCAEQPLYDYEGAVLGSINLSQFVIEDGVDWKLLQETVHSAVHFLDNALDANKYPLPQSEVICMQNRRIGLGVMGFADLLFKLKMPYGTEEAVELADSLMKFISENADLASRNLAKERGAFPNFAQSIYKDGQPIRNASRTSLSPTGSISLLAGCSASFDPVFSLSYKMRVMDKDIMIVNPYFEEALQKYKFFSEDMVKRVASNVSIQGFSDIPDEVKKIFKVVFDVSPEWQVRMQATFQRYTDNAISKTVNFPSWATTRDVEKVFMLAYKNGCKGITIYRDQSKQDQVINVNLDAHKNNVEQPTEQPATYCPECDSVLQESEDIQTCANCGFSRCRV
jgi:ribonucleoside-diphosphate reductase alpha chain